MPEPFADTDLVTYSLSRLGPDIYTFHTLRPSSKMTRTRDHIRLLLDKCTCDKRETCAPSIYYYSKTPTLKYADVKGTGEKDQHRNGATHRPFFMANHEKCANFSEECYCISASILNLMAANGIYYVSVTISAPLHVTLKDRFRCSRNEFARGSFSVAEDDTVAIKKIYQYPVPGNRMPLLPTCLNREMKHICNKTKQKDREHPDDSGKLTNQTHRYKISISQKADTICGITDEQMQKTTIKMKMKRKTWDGWRITFTWQKPLVFQSLFLLFMVLVIPGLTLGAKDETGVKYALSEPFNQCHGLFDKMEQHLVYLLRMQESIKEAIKNSKEYQEVLQVLCKGYGTHRAIEINGHDSDKNSLPTLQMVEDVASIIKKLNEFDSLNTKTTESPQAIKIIGVDNDAKSPPTLQITEDMGSNGTKLNESVSLYTKMTESPQEGLNHSVEFLGFGSCFGFMVILISAFLLWVERKKIDPMEPEKLLHKDENEELRPLNNIQATVQTEYRDEGKLVSSSTICRSSDESPVVLTTDHCSFEIDSSEHFSYKSLHEIPCTDSSYKVYPSSARPDLPNIVTINFSDLHSSESVYMEKFTRTDYCMDSTYLKQLSAEDETRLECLKYDRNTANDTSPINCEKEIQYDSKCTSSEDIDCTRSITSTLTSYPIQSKSLSDRKTSLYTPSLSSNEAESGQIVDVNSLDAKYGQLLVECQTGTENMFQGEKKHFVQTFNEVSNSYGDMKASVITEDEWIELEQQEFSESYVDCTDFKDSCVIDNEDDSQSTDQNDKAHCNCKNTEESNSSQSTKNIAEYVSGVENHNFMALEEIYNAHITSDRENSDREKLVENLNLLKEKGKTYPDCHQENNYLENMKENYYFEDMKEYTNSKTDMEYTNSGKKNVKSKNSNESANAKTSGDNVTLQDGIPTIRAENFRENAIPENVEANADVQNVQGKTSLQNVEEGSHLQKFDVNVFSKSAKGNANVYFKTDADCHLHNENGGYPTNLNKQKGPNKDRSVLTGLEFVSFRNIHMCLLDIYGSKFDTGEVEDTARTSWCAVGDLAERKSLCKSTLSQTTNFRHFQILEQMQIAYSMLVKLSFSSVIEQEIFGKGKRLVANEKTETILGNDTFHVDITPFVKTTSEDVCIKLPQIKIIEQTDQKTESNCFPRRLTCFQIFWCSICTGKFEIRQDHSMNFPWKQRTSPTLYVLKDNIAGEDTVKDERTCSCKDGIKVIRMVLMLTQPIKEDIIWTDKEYVKEIHQNTLLTVLNECLRVSKRDIHSECKGFAEKSLKMDSKSYIQEKIQKDVSLITLNNERSLQGKDSKTIMLVHRKEEDIKLNVNKVLEEILPIGEETAGKNQSFNMDWGEKLSVGSTTSGNEGFSNENLEMESKCYNQENVLDENASLIKLNRENRNKRNDDQKPSFGMEEEALKLDNSSDEILSTATETIEQDRTSTREDIKIQKTSSVILPEVETASVSSTVSEDEVLKEKSVEKDDECCKQAKLKEVSFTKLREEKNTFSEVHSDFGHTKACYSTEHEIETRKEDFNEEQKPEYLAVCVNVEDEQAQAQSVVKQNIGHTEPDIATESEKYAVVPYACISKQVTDSMGHSEPCLSSNFETDSEERGQGFKTIKHCLTRGPDSQECDLSENEIYMDELPLKQRVEMRKEHHPKPNTTSKLKLKQRSRSLDLKTSYFEFGSHQRVDRDTHVQKKHTYESEIIRSIDLISYKTKEESVSCLPDAVEQKIKEPCKACRTAHTKVSPCGYTDCKYRMGESTCLEHQQKNSCGKIGTVLRYFQNYDFLFQFSQCPQQNDNLYKDEKVKSAIRKRRRKQSQLIQKEQCSSFNKSSNRDFEIQQDFEKPLKLGERSRRISHGSSEQPNGKRSFTRSKRCRRVSKLGDKIDGSKNLSFESSSNDVLEQNLRPEIDQVVWQTLGESTDSGFGTIESYRSDVISEMEKVEHAFYYNEVKLSSKKLKRLKGKLQEKEKKIKKELSVDYINAILNPFYFRPELSSIVVYPGLQRYFERLQEGPLSQEESLSYEWLRLESLRNYDGAGSIIQLARGGFYHDPLDGPLSTRCYACNVLYTNWEYFDNVTEVHRRLSPNCPHLRGNASVSGNVSIDNGPPNRAESSVTAETPEGTAGPPSVSTVSSITDSLRGTRIRDMVSEGFPQQPTEDRLNTEYNRSSPSLAGTGPGFSLGIGSRAERNTVNQSSNTENGQDVNNTATSVASGNRRDVENRPNSARQPAATTTTTVSSPVITGASKIRERNLGNGGFSQNTASSTQTSQPTETIVQGLNNPQLVHVTNPKYSEYATIDSRSRSFTSMWPSYLDQTPQQMADAGFFYAGVADFTRCFACGGGLRNWEAGDDPCLEHTRWYPRCEYMNKLKGSRYVEAVSRRQEQHLAEQRRRNTEQQTQRRQAATNVSQDPMATPAAQTLLEMGYSRDRTKEAILAVRRNTGHTFVSAEQALIWILDQDEQEEDQAPVTTTQVTTTTGSSTSTSQRTTTTSSSSSQSSNSSGISSGSSSSASSGVTVQGQGPRDQGRSQGSPSRQERSGTPSGEDKNMAAEDESSEQRGANANGSQGQGKQKKRGKKKGKGGGANGKVGGDLGLRGGANKEGAAAGSVPAEIDTESLKAENEKLKEMQTCKICMDNPVNVTLLPCGHLVCCESCAPHLRKCPICRRRIDGSIKTFMS